MEGYSYRFKMRPRACPTCGCAAGYGGEAGVPEYSGTCEVEECGWAGLVDTVSEPGNPEERLEVLDAFDSVTRGGFAAPTFCPMCARSGVKATELGQRGSGHFDVHCQAPKCGWRGSITEV